MLSFRSIIMWQMKRNEHDIAATNLQSNRDGEGRGTRVRERMNSGAPLSRGLNKDEIYTWRHTKKPRHEYKFVYARKVEANYFIRFNQSGGKAR